ncbi:hypothetical protein [Bacteroides sp.]
MNTNEQWTFKVRDNVSQWWVISAMYFRFRDVSFIYWDVSSIQKSLSYIPLSLSVRT